jgi:hypothetical protein
MEQGLSSLAGPKLVHFRVHAGEIKTARAPTLKMARVQGFRHGNTPIQSAA